MDPFYRSFGILVLMAVNKENVAELTSALDKGAYNFNCTKPTLILHEIGYIQCQRACIRRSDCYIIRYNKEKLTCSIYLDVKCTAGVGKYKFIRRHDIEEIIVGLCKRNSCPPEHICIALRSGFQTCLPDKELQNGRLQNFSYLHFDGVVFILVEIPLDRDNAAVYCSVEFSGYLAVSNNGQIRHILKNAMLDIPTAVYWWVGGSFDGTTVLWYPKDEISDSSKCIAIRHDGAVMISYCSTSCNFVCEI